MGPGDQRHWRAFSQVATRLAIRGNTPKSKVVAAASACYWLELTLNQSWSTPIPKYPNKKINCSHSCFVCLYLFVCYLSTSKVKLCIILLYYFFLTVKIIIISKQNVQHITLT